MPCLSSCNTLFKSLQMSFLVCPVAIKFLEILLRKFPPLALFLIVEKLAASEKCLQQITPPVKPPLLLYLAEEIAFTE